jgi:predicted nucleotidyltransferase component of viral defense system
MSLTDTGFMPSSTREVFQTLSVQKFMNPYTLIGGTALAIQIKHRYSEDLDFITDAETINTLLLKRNIARLFPDYKIIRDDPKWQIDVLINNTKITWFSSGAVAANFKTRDYAFSYKNLWIARPEIIAVHKLSAISQQNTLRDYYDLYFLVKYHIPLETIIELTRELQPSLSPVTYTETLIYVDDLPEENMSLHLEPAENISKQQISEFFISELKKIKNKLI